MKQTVEVDIPDGYEIVSKQDEINIGEMRPVVVLHIKKKQTKDFDFYVDEYLRSDPFTTNNMLCNWWDRDTLEVIGNNLKQNKLQFVPWEVKIGLVKFICKDKSLCVPSVIYDLCGETCDSSDTDKIRQICPIEFLNSIAL